MAERHPNGTHRSKGQWAHRVTSDWQTRCLPEPIGAGSLAAAVLAEKNRFTRDCSPYEAQPQIIRTNNQRTQPLWQKIPVFGLDIIEIWQNQKG